MAEVQTNTQSGQMAQRFVEFVMMQAQNAALFLGQIPNPQTGKGEVNLDVARMFIDQLAMIQEKTRGNLSNEEATVLRNAISNLQMAFVEVSEAVKKGGRPAAEAETETEAPPPPTASEPTSSTSPAPAPASPEQTSPATPAGEGESKKKFTKSYGA